MGEMTIKEKQPIAVIVSAWCKKHQKCISAGKLKNCCLKKGCPHYRLKIKINQDYLIPQKGERP